MNKAAPLLLMVAVILFCFNVYHARINSGLITSVEFRLNNIDSIDSTSIARIAKVAGFDSSAIATLNQIIYDSEGWETLRGKLVENEVLQSDLLLSLNREIGNLQQRMRYQVRVPPPPPYQFKIDTINMKDIGFDYDAIIQSALESINDGHDK